MKKYSIILFLLSSFLFSQNEYVQYKSKANTLYWKNRKPYEGYWQQDVHYNIHAALNDSTDIITGEEEIIYWNNSPDELSEIFFHLYNNAQCKNSYLSDLYKNNKAPLKYGKYREKNVGIEIIDISIQGQGASKYEIDNTIMKLALDKKLKQNDSIVIKVKFKTYFDKEAIRNRMKLFNAFGYKHYDVVHWYPRVSVYDKKMRWDTQQHMDHEFYGDFGSYYVEFSFPNNYIVDGTGIMLNEDEVMPKTLRQQLDISNFLKKPFNSAPSEIVKKNNTYKTWKFSAINVHDVAYTADPTYRIGEKTINGIRCIALVQEPHAVGWYNAADYMTKIIETNTQNIGRYYYPKIICADAQDGMEYPMLTLDGGFDPYYRTLFIHEMTHNWFFGMVGSNETYRAFLDEGFTQFYTADTYQFIDGPFVPEQVPTNFYEKSFFDQTKEIDASVYNPYYYYVVMQKKDMSLNTHSDDFNGALRHDGGYGLVYYKTATMLKNLEYVLGRKLFDESMKHYFEKWKFCHPYPEDFRESIIEYTQTDLNWFFDQWLETTKTIDYKISKIKRIKKTESYQITFKRKGEMQMPLDFVVIDKQDSAHYFHIPNTWFEKNTSATKLPRWIGWGNKLKPTYTATVNIHSKIKQVVIDPTYRLADVDWTNNIKPIKLDVKFDSKTNQQLNWKSYDMRLGPNIWYNGYDGLKFGLTLSGNYLKIKHQFDATLWFNSGFLQNYLDTSVGKASHYNLSALLNYKTAINKIFNNSNVYLQGKLLDGLKSGLAGVEHYSYNRKTRYYIYYKAMWRDQNRDLVYLLLPNEWTNKTLNGAFHFGVEKNYNYNSGFGQIMLDIRASAFSNATDYSYAQVQHINTQKISKLNFRTRLFAQYGVANAAPYESMLYVAGANPEMMMDNKYVRSMGIIPPDWAKYGAVTNHFSYGGGLNLRGYNGYVLPTLNKDGSIQYNYKGLTGFSANAELEFGQLFSFLKIKKLGNAVKIEPYFFGDVGTININKPNTALKFYDALVDAGAGVALTINKWGPITQVKPLTIRFDSPMFINRLPYNETTYFQFRWLLTINKSF